MEYITTTQLRTRSSQLVKSLRNGTSVSLIHRSQILGEIKPKRAVKTLTKEDIIELKNLARKLNLPKLSYKQRERIYRKHLEEKYGKSIS